MEKMKTSKSKVESRKSKADASNDPRPLSFFPFFIFQSFCFTTVHCYNNLQHSHCSL